MAQLAHTLMRILLPFGLIMSFSLTGYTEPANLGLLKQKIKRYHDSGTYDQELSQTITQAQRYLTAKVQTNRHLKHPLQLAIVLDIDETSLSNYNQFIEQDFGANRQRIHEYILSAKAPVIKPMLKLYQQSLKQGVHVFFVTGRHQSECAATKRNLLKAGYSKWSGLYCRPDTYNQSSIIPFKSQTRAKITQQGYTIVASIGDQYSDLKGGYAEKGFKLPNPFYYLP